MKSDDEWMETNSNFCGWDALDMKQFISEVQGDALRHAAQIVHKNPITAYHELMALAFEVDP
jgi:hypothetical protein